ncbi:MAG: DUF5050 domain-containing protein [Clostridia bacterium]|jgi:hypothetical protein|nr:DUF5050 domain-containing protein [Clostridia bacterium]MBT7122130.1 DUF5050 domain-containing protein [Clostridia bacterium]
MKKTIFKTLIVLLIVILAACAPTDVVSEIVIIPIPVEDRMAQIDELFTIEDFDGVAVIYKEAVGDDKQIIKAHINEYALIYIENAKQELSTKSLTEFMRTGFDGESLPLGIDLVERLIVSEQAYTEGKIAFNGRDFETAKEQLTLVDEAHNNYENAQQCLADISSREDAWNAVQYGRNPGTYSLASDDEFTYIAFEHEGVFGILKIDDTGDYTEFIPLSDSGDYIIKGINIVGDFIYFIAGESVGRGLMVTDPYCIYEMKTDGSGLALVAAGDYFDMVIYDSAVYALSYTKGLVELSNDFTEETVLADGNVIEFSVQPQGIYYTVQQGLTYESVNTVYFYDGDTHESVMSDDFLHYYIYANSALKLYSSGSKSERLYLETADDDIQVASTDILKVYGLIGGRVIYSTPGNDAQERLKDYDIESDDTQAYLSVNDLPEYYIIGLCYETEKIFTVNSDGIYMMDVGFENAVTLQIAPPDADALSENMALVRHLNDTELYTQEETVVVISDELLWFYSDATLNVTVERRFFEETEVTAYITHIRTTDFSLLTTDSWGGDPDSRSTVPAAELAGKYGVIYGQSTDFFNYKDTTNSGIVIRKGEVFRDHIYRNMMAIYPDGSFVTYVKGDSISAERLIEDGVQTSLSFGPVLVEGGFLSSNSTQTWVLVRNPRSAIGMVEPGHYVSIVVEGRCKESRGLTTVALGELFAQEGCEVAYNMDGGGTVSITFLGNSLYLSSNYRHISDILYFGTSELVPIDLDEFVMTFEEFTNTEGAEGQE